MFISEGFTFNGKRNTEFKVSLVEFDSSVLNEIGIVYSRDISKEDGSDINPSYNVSDSDAEDIVLNLILLDANDNILSWDEETLLSVKHWLVTDDFAPFISDDNPDYVYYMQCSRIVNKFTFGMEGVLEVTLKPISCYAYKLYEKDAHITGNSNIYVFNPTNKNYYPIIEVTNLGNTSTVNKINDFSLTGLNSNETVRIDNLMLTVLNRYVNRLSNCNRSWIKLVPGDNILSISGNCVVKILAEFPIII